MSGQTKPVEKTLRWLPGPAYGEWPEEAECDTPYVVAVPAGNGRKRYWDTAVVVVREDGSLDYADGGDTWAPIVRDLPPVLSVEVQTLP